MKALLGKIVRSYGIQFAILLLLQISTDLPCSILVMCHNFNGFICSLVFYEVDNRLYVRDGAKVTYSLLVINILVIFGCLLSSFIVTIKSQIKYKWIVLLCMLIYSMFLPIVGFLQLGGIAGGINREYMSFLYCLIEGLPVEAMPDTNMLKFNLF